MYDPTSDLLQEGVSCALAILHAIEGADLFRAAPADEGDKARHNNGCQLIAMLYEHLSRIQTQVDGISDARVSVRREGR